MHLVELRNQIENLAWGPRGTDGLRAATASPSPVAVVCAAFQDMRGRSDLNEVETEILRACCQLIRSNQWHGLAQDTVEVEAALPPPPTLSASPIQAPDND
ncbi:hypothetical protein [Aquidulcibacter sp.]|uniref:hypothetical protein n=1 Tax=Aquidulcibacter sp. TaxID=2052990 RepID=UPI0025C03A2A|nr:hypothetical protein [Aquidulcibacter sp.]MCA3696242.1 hypothetical protein [Aquidulcibacter sp.]